MQLLQERRLGPVGLHQEHPLQLQLSLLLHLIDVHQVSLLLQLIDVHQVRLVQLLLCQVGLLVQLLLSHLPPD
jgi:hypothetical protein